MARNRDGGRRGGKAAAAVAPVRMKMSASVKPETYMKLATHALWTGSTQGELIDELVAEHCRRFQVRDMENRKASSEVEDRPDPVEDGSESGGAEAA